jgi:hypothetical protein
MHNFKTKGIIWLYLYLADKSNRKPPSTTFLTHSLINMFICFTVYVTTAQPASDPFFTLLTILVN